MLFVQISVSWHGLRGSCWPRRTLHRIPTPSGCSNPVNSVPEGRFPALGRGRSADVVPAPVPSRCGSRSDRSMGATAERQSRHRRSCPRGHHRRTRRVQHERQIPRTSSTGAGYQRRRRNLDIALPPSPPVGFGSGDVGDRSSERRTDQQRAQVPTRGDQAGYEHRREIDPHRDRDAEQQR